MELLFCFVVVIGILGVTHAGPEYDFEDPQQVNLFTPEGAGGSCSISSLHYKSGSHSLLWQWASRNDAEPPATLTVRLGPTLKLEGKELKDGGIKFWMYRESASPATTMEIIFRGENGSSSNAVATSPTIASLNFVGWRGVWIGYLEFGSEITSSFTAITSVEFKITSKAADKLFLDIIRFATSIRKQSRDVVVPKVGSASRSGDPPFYDNKDFWQQSLRWYTTPLARSTTPIENVDAKIAEIHGIEMRLENWYSKVGETLKTVTTLDDFAVDMATDPEGGIDYQALKQKRWRLLQTDIEAANSYYNKIDFVKKRPPLFTKVEEIGEDFISDDPNFKSKFGFFFARILLPLSLEYNFMTRAAEINALGNRVCNNLKSSNYLTMLQAITEITGNDHVLVDTFQVILNTYKSKLNCASRKGLEEVSAADLIILYNDFRWERIKALLEFIQAQGWAEGSGLGSIDHEMNKAGSGFMHSMFLLRHALRQSANAQLFNRLLGAMKWYNDFNEIYQDDNAYEYEGTTADRLRTILLYRLMIVLIPPNTNKEAKIRDLVQLRIWMKHTLRVNKGLGGVIKPDFTGFHHKTFYGSAYVPHALHNAALVQYLLEGTTNFKLDDISKKNLREALSVLRMVSVKYSSPNAIGGRFPGYNNTIIAQQFPAYAYISYKREGTTDKAKGRDMFLRLFNHTEPSIKAYLEDGTIKSGIYYWNTIGQIDVFKQVSNLICTEQCNAEISPSGHWSKNFAGLSIHRRHNWTVAAKGFNRYTWDYEGTGKENVFGAFASHGSLQISNSESLLKSYDVNDGWDWTRVPGATTIKVELVNIALSKARNYNPGNFAGGVSFSGSIINKPRNGAFGMFYTKPKYDLKKNKASPMDSMVFEFKKSYFFYNDLIVCLGSDIKFQNHDIRNYYAQTTLFQDKLLDPSRASTITYDSQTHDLRLLLTRKYRWKSGKTVRLVDTNGNTYEVKDARTKGLNVQVQDQESVSPNGCDKSKARYATAWFEHKNKQALPCTTTTTTTLTDNIENEKDQTKNPMEDTSAMNTDTEKRPQKDKEIVKESAHINATAYQIFQNGTPNEDIKSMNTDTEKRPQMQKDEEKVKESAHINATTHQKFQNQMPNKDFTKSMNTDTDKRTQKDEEKVKESAHINATTHQKFQNQMPNKDFTKSMNTDTDKRTQKDEEIVKESAHINATAYRIFQNGTPNEDIKSMNTDTEKRPQLQKDEEMVNESAHINATTHQKFQNQMPNKDFTKSMNTDTEKRPQKDEEIVKESAHINATAHRKFQNQTPKENTKLLNTNTDKRPQKDEEMAHEPADIKAKEEQKFQNQTLKKDVKSMNANTQKRPLKDGAIVKDSTPKYPKVQQNATPKKAKKNINKEKATINDMYVDGTNINADTNDPQSEVQAPDYLENRARFSEDFLLHEHKTMPMFLPSRFDKIKAENIDKDADDENSQSIDEKADNMTDEGEMDGLGSDNEYDDGTSAAETASETAAPSTPTTAAQLTATDEAFSTTTTTAEALATATTGTTAEALATAAAAKGAVPVAEPEADAATADSDAQTIAATVTGTTAEAARETATDDTTTSSDSEAQTTPESTTIDSEQAIAATVTGTTAEAARETATDDTTTSSDSEAQTTPESRTIDSDTNNNEHIIPSDPNHNEESSQKKDYSNETISSENSNMETPPEHVNNTFNGTMRSEDQNTQIEADNDEAFSNESVMNEDRTGASLEASERNEQNSTQERYEKQTMDLKDEEKEGMEETENGNEDNVKTTRNDEMKMKNRTIQGEKKDKMKNKTVKNGTQNEDNYNKEKNNQMKKGLILNDGNNLPAKEDLNLDYNSDNLHEKRENNTDNANKNSYKGSNNSENNMKDKQDLQQRRKLKQMKKKTAEVKRKLKLKLNQKSVTYNKLHKVMKIAMQNANKDNSDDNSNDSSEAARKDEKEINLKDKDKYGFFYNSTLTRDSNENQKIDEKPDNSYESFTDEVKNSDTTATSTSSYEYAIVVKGGELSLFSKYRVISQTGKAHAVEFNNLPDYPDPSTKVFSYSIFESFTTTESISSGPVVRTSLPCMTMAELSSNTLYLALSNPAITFQDDAAVKTRDSCTRAGRKDIKDKFSPVNSDEVGAKMMFCVESAPMSITVSLRLDKGLSSTLGTVKVDGKVQQNAASFVRVDAAKKEVTFSNLLNGFTTEVALRLV